MPLHKNMRRAISVLAYVVAFNTLLAYGLPGGLFGIFILGLGVLYYRIAAAEAVTLSVSLVLVTLMYSVALKLTGFENAIYYRPDEKLSEYRADLGHLAYRRDTTMHMHMPYGDLQPMTSVKIGVPRDVTYHIDGYGFRNDADYAGERYVLVGDSFVAGSSNTQTDLLSAQLRHAYGLATYNLAHPGGLPDYANYVDAFASSHRGFKVLLFVFEGNDFEVDEQKKPPKVLRAWRRYYTMFSGINVYRVTKSLIRRASQRAQITGSVNVTVRELNGHPIGFLTRYIEATRDRQRPTIPSFEHALLRLRPYLAHVYFIPTKYRVYYRAVESSQAPALADTKWEYLKQLCVRDDLACTNLTAPMLRKADALRARGELLWWPDDTHWNGRGIAVAAQVVTETLKGDEHGARRARD